VRDNPTLHWTGPASGVVVNWKPVGAVPAIERQSVIPPMRNIARLNVPKGDVRRLMVCQT
jgi:hypothetical protein